LVGGVCQRLGVVVGEVAEAFDYAGAEGLARALLLREPYGDEREADHLRRERLGRRYAHLYARVTVDATVHLARDERVHHVHDADGYWRRGAQDGEAAVEVLRLARLRDEDYGHSVGGFGEVRRSELGGVDCLHGDEITQLLGVFGAVEGGVVGRPAPQDDEMLGGLELLAQRFEPAQLDFGIAQDASAHVDVVHDGARLVVNLLEGPVGEWRGRAVGGRRRGDPIYEVGRGGGHAYFIVVSINGADVVGFERYIRVHAPVEAALLGGDDGEGVGRAD